MLRRTALYKILLLLAATVLLTSSACPGARGAKGNIVLVTIESLRADRLIGPISGNDPFAALRAAAGAERIRPVLASSSESLPSLASLMTGASAARHGTIVEGLDRLAETLPTAAMLLAAAGYRTGGFPSSASLGLSSGLSRGFQAYGWSPLDQVSQSALAETDREGWAIDAGRRPGQATVADALKWVRRHREEPLFLWLHLSEAAPPYATDRALISGFQGSMYDASMAYEDRCLKTLMEGFQAAGLSERTTFIVAGNHGESLGAHGESFHGLNLYPEALTTAVAFVPPRGNEKALAAALGQGGPGRLQDLFAVVLALGGVEPAGGTEARPGLPPVSPDLPLLALTLGPRSAFGWSGRVALYDGEWAWSGPSDEEVFPAAVASAGTGAGAVEDTGAGVDTGAGAGTATSAGPQQGAEAGARAGAPAAGTGGQTEEKSGRAPVAGEVAAGGAGREASAGGMPPGAGGPGESRSQSLRARALALAAPIAERLAGRASIPPPDGRARVVDLLRAAASARETQSRDGELAALREAWQIDTGNFEVARWLAHANGAQAKADNQALAQEVESRGAGLPEALMAVARIFEVSPTAGSSLEPLRSACKAGAAGCSVDLALRLGRAGKYEDAAQVLEPVAEKGQDADLWRTLGDLYFAVENTYKAGQAYGKAAALRPRDPDVLMRQGDCLAALRDFKSAQERYEAARAAQPDLTLVELRLGALARQSGDRAGAVEHFRKGIGTDPNTAAGAIALGRILSEQGMTQEAIPLFLDAASRDTASGDGYYHAAEAMAAEGRLEEAEKSLRQALEREPKNASILYQLARLLVYRGSREEAGRLLEQLAQTANMDIAVAALRDPLFSNESDNAPLAKGLQAVYEVVQRSLPQGGGVVVVQDPSTGPPGSASAAPGGSPAVPGGPPRPGKSPENRPAGSAPAGPAPHKP